MNRPSWQIGPDSTSEVRRYSRVSFTTEAGARLADCPIAYSSWGTLNEAGDNCIVVCHALTGNTDAADWWSGLVGSGRVLDTDRYFVICLNVPGSPYGSIGPLTVNPETGVRYGAAFPAFTVRDTVAIHRIVLEDLGVTQVVLAAGGSLGGMQAAEWAFETDFVKTAAIVACGASHSPWCIGWSNAQRAAIMADAAFEGGAYELDHQPTAGLAVARQIAMMTYRSFGEFDDRFGRRLSDDGSSFSVSTYLDYQGQKLVSRFDANCYIALTRTMDSHDIRRDRSELTCCPTLVVGITTDVLYPLDEQKQLSETLPDSELAILDSPFGHDAFLIEQNKLNALISEWLNKIKRTRRSFATHVACDA